VANHDTLLTYTQMLFVYVYAEVISYNSSRSFYHVTSYVTFILSLILFLASLIQSIREEFLLFPSL